MPSIDSPLGFADSTLLRYTREPQRLSVRLTAWNGSELRVVFSGVVALRDVQAGEFSDLVCGAPHSSQFLAGALAAIHETVPREHEYQVFSFLNHDSEPSLEVVAASCEVHAASAIEHGDAQE